MNHYGTGRTYTRVLRQRCNRLRGDSSQRSSSPGKNLLTETQRRPTAHTRSEHDREQLGRAQCGCTVMFEPLTRALEARQLSNT
jgi:hypothetical protein